MSALIVCDHPGCNNVDLMDLTGGPRNGLHYCSLHHPDKKQWHGEFPPEQYDPQQHTVANRPTGIGLS